MVLFWTFSSWFFFFDIQFEIEIEIEIPNRFSFFRKLVSIKEDPWSEYTIAILSTILNKKDAPLDEEAIPLLISALEWRVDDFVSSQKFVMFVFLLISKYQNQVMTFFFIIW